MKITQKRISILLIGAVAIIVFALCLNQLNNKYEQYYDSILGTEFSGGINKLFYSIKGYPHVEIGSKSYIFPFANHNQLMNGDSLTKRKNSFYVKQYRNKILIETYKWQ